MTFNQFVMDFEGDALSGMAREQQVHLIWIIIRRSYVPKSAPDSVHLPEIEKVDF